jgi:hypothetical protein
MCTFKCCVFWRFRQFFANLKKGSLLKQDFLYGAYDPKRPFGSRLQALVDCLVFTSSHGMLGTSVDEDSDEEENDKRPHIRVKIAPSSRR